MAVYLAFVLECGLVRPKLKSFICVAKQSRPCDGAKDGITARFCK